MPQVFRTVIFFWLAATGVLQAQIPDLIKKGTDAIQNGRFPQQAPTQSSGRRGTQPSTVSAGQCQALVQWISILQREDPNIDFLHTPMGPKLYDQLINLYRDEAFVPLYGRSFSQTAPEERLAFFRTVLLPCSRSSGQVSPTDQAMLRQYQGLLGRPFSLSGRADFSGDYVIAGLALRQALVAWAQQTTQTLDRLPATPQGFQELDTDLKRGQTDLDKLWPREKAAFIQAITTRQSLLARGILDNTGIAAGKEAAKGLDGVRSITALYQGQQRYMQLLDPQAKVQVKQQKDQALLAAVDAAIPAEKQKIAAMPASLDGAIAIADWEQTFNAAVTGMPASSALQSLLADAEQKRQHLLIAGLPEFKAAVAQHPKPGRNGVDAQALMGSLFPNGGAALPEYQEYQSLLSARLDAEVKAKAAGEEAAAQKAAEEESKAIARKYPGSGLGPKTSCDTYAAHPLDKGRAAGVIGVMDDKIASEQAIAACQQAVKSAPKTARFQFQLGRAYWAAEQYDESLDAMLKAEELGYAPAYFYLAMAYEDGLAGEKGQPDLETARDMYMVAASEGFEPAVAAFQDFEDVPDEDPGGAIDIYAELKKPDMMKALIEGNSAPLVQSPADSLHYIIGIQGALIDNDNVLDDTLSAQCRALASAEFSTDLQTALNREGQNRMDSLKGTGGQVLTALLTGMGAVGANRATEELGEDDMFFVVGLSDGGCGGPTIQKLYKNVKAILPSVTAAIAKSPAGR